MGDLQASQELTDPSWLSHGWRGFTVQAVHLLYALTTALTGWEHASVSRQSETYTEFSYIGAGHRDNGDTYTVKSR